MWPFSYFRRKRVEKELEKVRKEFTAGARKQADARIERPGARSYLYTKPEEPNYNDSFIVPLPLVIFDTPIRNEPSYTPSPSYEPKPSYEPPSLPAEAPYCSDPSPSNDSSS